MSLEIDPFIGYRFQTRKNSVIRVTKRSSTKLKKYEIHCSICSNDKELFPLPLEMERYHLLRGKVPCECSRSPKLKEFQHRIKCKRKSERERLQFKGFIEPFKGRDTKIVLFCPLHGHEFNPTIKSFLSNINLSCSQCHKNFISDIHTSHYKLHKPTFLFLVEFIDMKSDKRFYGISYSNTVKYLSKLPLSTSDKERYETNIVSSRYHASGKIVMEKIEAIKGIVDTHSLIEKFVTFDDSKNLNAIIDIMISISREP